MSAEFWAILGVGVAVLGLGWRVYARLDARLDILRGGMSAVKERLARIEGWIARRFREDVSA